MRNTIEINNHIVASSDICHGKPVFRGTRILVSDILELMASGESIDEIMKEYPTLNKKMIMGALGYAANNVQ